MVLDVDHQSRHIHSSSSLSECFGWNLHRWMYVGLWRYTAIISNFTRSQLRLMLLTAYCTQPVKIIRLIMPPLSGRIHSLNSICSDYNPTSQHYLIINLSMESESMVTLPTPGSSLQPFMFSLKCSLSIESLNFFFVSAVFTKDLKLFFHHCRTNVQILF